MTDENFLEELDLEDFAKKTPGQSAPAAHHYKIRIDKTVVTVNKPVLTGREILALVDKTPERYKLYEHLKGKQPKPIGPDEEVNLRDPGVERFTTMPRDTTEGLDQRVLTKQFSLPRQDEEYLNGLALPWETIVDGGSRWLLIHKWHLPGGYNAARITVALLISSQYADTHID